MHVTSSLCVYMSIDLQCAISFMSPTWSYWALSLDLSSSLSQHYPFLGIISEIIVARCLQAFGYNIAERIQVRTRNLNREARCLQGLSISSPFISWTGIFIWDGKVCSSLGHSCSDDLALFFYCDTLLANASQDSPCPQYPIRGVSSHSGKKSWRRARNEISGSKPQFQPDVSISVLKPVNKTWGTQVYMSGK